VASAGASHRDASAADDATSSTQAGDRTCPKAILGCQFTRFRQLIAKNAGHDVTLENNAQETFHQILDFVHHAVPVQQHADLMLETTLESTVDGTLPIRMLKTPSLNVAL
jgi:hypothetical protein